MAIGISWWRGAGASVMSDMEIWATCSYSLLVPPKSCILRQYSFVNNFCVQSYIPTYSIESSQNAQVGNQNTALILED